MHNMFRKLIATSPTWVTLPLRLALGVIFIAHGSQKVLGAFGGPGLQTFIANNPPFPFMRPTWLWMGAAAFSEFLGGILVLVGFLTRIGAFFIACVMLTAIFGVHLSNGFFAPKGFEYPFALLFVTLALLIAGGGAASVDLALSDERSRRRR
jgi:putative oxidoreductase